MYKMVQRAELILYQRSTVVQTNKKDAQCHVSLKNCEVKS